METGAAKAYIINLVERAFRQEQLTLRATSHRTGPGRRTVLNPKRPGKNYGVGFCAGVQERERRAARRVEGPTTSIPPFLRRTA